MTAAYFEDHPTDPDKVIMRKPPHDIDLFCRAVTTPEKWVGLTESERHEILVNAVDHKWDDRKIVKVIEDKLKEKNNGQ